MKIRKRIVFATNNAHKLEEAREILGDRFEIMSLAEIDCHDEIPETADTLEGNALIKARWVKDKYGYDCFSDDTGLMVDALNGAPGVYSARYAGEACSPADNVAKLLAELKDIEDRRAHFATVVALVSEGKEHCFEGRVDGRIATEPHGHGGFGYDPVFIADESGKCFAEMAPKDKNAISHRGRAMRKLAEFLSLFIIAFLCALFPVKANAEEWRLHASYDGQMDRVIDTPKFTYFLGLGQKYDPKYSFTATFYGFLMRYDKEGDEFQMLNSLTKLSGNNITAIEYNYPRNCLAIAYEDGNFDFLYDDGKVVNVPGLKLADSSLQKKVNSINFSLDGKTAYLSTNFGLVAIDEALGEVDTSRVFNTPIKATAVFDGKLWLAANDKIYAGSPNSMRLEDYEEIADVADVFRMYALDNRGLYILHSRVKNYQCTIIKPDGDGYSTKVFMSGNTQGLEPMKSGLALSVNNALQLFMADGSTAWITLADEDKRSVAGSYNAKDFWISSGRNGISQKRIPEKGGSWTVLKNNFHPNASSAFMCSAMEYSPQYGVLVRNHGVDANFNSDKGNYIETEDLISAYKDMNWKPVSTTYNCDSQGLTVVDPAGVVIDPNNSSHVYCGSVVSGLLRLDLSDPTKSLRFGKSSDKNGGNGQPGFVIAVDEPVANAFWAERCLFSAPTFDASGNLWAMYVNPVPEEGGSTYSELWYWTPENRSATTSASNFRPFKKIRFDGLECSNTPVIKALTTNANQNIILFHGNVTNGPLVVYDHNGTLGTRNDDKSVKILNFIDQDGTTVPYNYISTFYEEPSTGIVWVATNKSIFKMNPHDMLNNSTSVQRIKISRNDGTGLADYLLDNVRVNCILADAVGNKWFATGGAGLMCTTSDGTTVLHSYTSSNSPLPGDNVYSIALNPDANSMMISTDKGLCELFLSGTVADSSDDVRIYPNPARPDFHGYVTIDGLPMGAMVKIVDTAGTVVKELGQADLGSIEWDLTNQSYKKVPGGVYFVVATNGPDADSYTKMGKLLVVN